MGSLKPRTNPLKRRAVRVKKGSKPPEYIAPTKKGKGSTYTRTKDYQYFEGHVIPEIAEKMSSGTVICWYNGHMVSLPACVIRKFWLQQSYCKRCSLFQRDEHSQELRSLIEEWEKDDLQTED